MLYSFILCRSTGKVVEGKVVFRYKYYRKALPRMLLAIINYFNVPIRHIVEAECIFKILFHIKFITKSIIQLCR